MRIKRCYQKDTLRALEMGAAETLVCWENLDVQRITLKNHASGEEKILHLTSEQEKDKTHFTDSGKPFHNFHHKYLTNSSNFCPYTDIHIRLGKTGSFGP